MNRDAAMLEVAQFEVSGTGQQHPMHEVAGAAGRLKSTSYRPFTAETRVRFP